MNNDICRCDKGFIGSSSNYECDKSCDVGEYLDYKNCKYRSKLVDTLVQECVENINENELIYNAVLVQYVLYYLPLHF